MSGSRLSMERPPVSTSAGSEGVNGAQPPDFACFGKLPGSGDFVSRRMPYALQQFWDHWFADGMEALRAGRTVSGWELWGNTPMWAFLLPAQSSVPWAQVGVLAPSCDRVGRNFPFLVTVPIVPDKIPLLIPRVAGLVLAWSDVIREAQLARQGIDLLDVGLGKALVAVLAAVPETGDSERTLPRGMNPTMLPWPDLASTFDVQGRESYWWSVPPIRTGFRAQTHAGGLNVMHFLGLCT